MWRRSLTPFLTTTKNSSPDSPLKPFPAGENCVACPVCSEARYWSVSFLKEGGGSHPSRLAGYFWGVCKKCGTAFPSKKKFQEERVAYWKNNRIDEGGGPVTGQIWDGRLDVAQQWARLTRRFVQPWLRTGMRTFLDIGCGLGATVAEFQSRGWDAMGIDPDPNVLPFHQKQGLKTQISSFEDCPVCGPFDLIASAHAIYFAEDPAGFVVKAGSLLSPGGLFVVLSTQLLSWRNHNRPSYLTSWFPTPESLQLLFHLNGFRLLDFQSKKGSDFFLFEKGAGPRPSCHPRRAWLLHWTHRLRYVILGWPLSLLKRLIGK